VRQKITALTRSVIGPEIIEETTNSIVVKDLLDASNFSMQKGLKRMYLIAGEMQRGAFSELLTHERKFDIMARDDEVDKFYWMVAKQYNMMLKDVFYAEKLCMTPQVALGYLLVGRSVERIADHAAKIAANAANVKKRVPIVPKVMEASNKTLGLMDRAMSAFFKGDFEDANDVVTQSRALEETISSLSHEVYALKLDPVSVVSMAYIIDSLGRTLSYTVDIAEAAINHNYVVGQTPP
jgi:phosphate uptake regulator